MENNTGSRWWTAFDESTTCPISLVPIRELPHPPFALMEANGAANYFDPRFLAQYLVSTAEFSNPVNRRALTRTECAALDRLLREPAWGADFADALEHEEWYSTGSTGHQQSSKFSNVVDAYDLQQSIAAERAARQRGPQAPAGDTAAARRARQLRREAGTVLHALFQFGRSATAPDVHDASKGAGKKGTKGKRRGLAASNQSLAEQLDAAGRHDGTVFAEGNLCVIGDDAYLFDDTHLRNAASEDFPALVSSATGGGSGSSAVAEGPSYHFVHWPWPATADTAGMSSRKGRKGMKGAGKKGRAFLPESHDQGEHAPRRPTLQLKPRSEALKPPGSESAGGTKASSIFGEGKARDVVQEYDFDAPDDALYSFMQAGNFLSYSRELLLAIFHGGLSDAGKWMKRVEKEVENAFFVPNGDRPAAGRGDDTARSPLKPQPQRAGTTFEIRFVVTASDGDAATPRNQANSAITLTVRAKDAGERQAQMRCVAEFAAHCLLDTTEVTTRSAMVGSYTGASTTVTAIPMLGSAPSVGQRTLQLGTTSRTRLRGAQALPTRVALLAEPLLRHEEPDERSGSSLAQLLLEFPSSLVPARYRELVAVLGGVYQGEVLVRDGPSLLLGFPTRQKAVVFFAADGGSPGGHHFGGRCLWFSGGAAWLVAQKRWQERERLIRDKGRKISGRNEGGTGSEGFVCGIDNVAIPAPSSHGPTKKAAAKLRAQNAFAALLSESGDSSDGGGSSVSGEEKCSLEGD